MNDPSNAPIHANGYHAHVYYDISTRPIAERLTDGSADDHSRYALWLATPVPLRLGARRPSYRRELLSDN